jgi:hypothetical protein
MMKDLARLAEVGAALLRTASIQPMVALKKK